MSQIAEGSPEWFRRCRQEVNLHLRARDCFEQAAQNVDRMLRHWDTLDAELKGVLFDSTVIHYARPFGQNKASSRYPLKRLKSYLGFDRELHGHICDLRDQLVAHHDNDVLRGLARHEYIDLNIGGVKTSILTGTVGIVKALHGINNCSVAERYANHLHASVACVREVAEDRLSALHSTARQYPENADADTITASIGTVPTASSLQAELPPTFDRRFPGISDPKFPLLPPDAYVYRIAAMARREIGTFPVDTPAGRGHIEFKEGPFEDVPIATFQATGASPGDVGAEVEPVVQNSKKDS